jgi:hypothetical protein
MGRLAYDFLRFVSGPPIRMCPFASVTRPATVRYAWAGWGCAWQRSHIEYTRRR